MHGSIVAARHGIWWRGFPVQGLPTLTAMTVTGGPAGDIAQLFALERTRLLDGRLSRSDVPAVRAAVLTGVMIASYTLVDGLGVRRAHDPYPYAALLFLLLLPVVVLWRRPRHVWRPVRP